MEAHRRLALKPGEPYGYPRGDLSGRYGAPRPANDKVVQVAYLPEVYGEKVLGGTQALYLAAVPFDKLGLPHGNVPDYAYALADRGGPAPALQGDDRAGGGPGRPGAAGAAQLRRAPPRSRRANRARAIGMSTHEHAPLGGTPLHRLRSSSCSIILVLGDVWCWASASSSASAPPPTSTTAIPWGIWIAIDLIVGTALGCGGFVMAFLVYILNRGQYHPLVRAGLMTSLFGYSLGGLAVMFDLGRWWQGYNIMLPWLCQRQLGPARDGAVHLRLHRWCCWSNSRRPSSSASA